MKYLFINSFAGAGSTGRIAAEQCRALIKEGNECCLAYGREKPLNCEGIQTVRIGTDLDVAIHGIASRLFDSQGFESKRATRKFLRWASDFNPDILWIHNLHGYYINIELLFEWIKSRKSLKVFWTLHDCWAFTGHCAYFTFAKCSRWKVHCDNCIQTKCYPRCIGKGNAYENFERKKSAFVGVEHMTLYTPSNWLAGLVAQSYLKSYPIVVHYNHVDTTVFKPTRSNFREKYGLKNKIIVLGVAFAWSDRKGLSDFVKLATMLDDRFVVVLVGLNDKQIRKLPSKIVKLRRTSNALELAQIYTAADVYLNPSVEETFGMTTAEASACGTKSIVYKGSASEEVAHMYNGIVVDSNVESLFKQLMNMFPVNM